jgi:pimeloyl-ACP methyl ester carboxylesterase
MYHPVHARYDHRLAVVKPGEIMSNSNGSNAESHHFSRRAMLVATAAAGAAAVAPGSSGRAEAASSQSNPMVPVPIPPQAPAKDGVAQLADTRLWYWDTGGAGQAVVLLHPASGSALIWGYQQPVFAKAGYRVIAYSRRGYNGSEPVPKENPGIASEDLQHLIELLGVGKFHLVGSAAGGSIASDYALSHPDRLSSLAISSNSLGIRDGDIFKAATAIRPKGWDDMPVEFRELGPSYRAANPEGARLWLELEHKALTGNRFGQTPANQVTEAKLKEIKVPTLLIAGAADLITPPSITRMIADRIPNCEMVSVEETGHSVYWEQPEIFNRAVLEFIAKHKT